METVKLDNLKDIMEKMPDNRETTVAGSICIAVWFPDNAFYMFEAQEVIAEDFTEENGKFFCQTDKHSIGFAEHAYYWRVLS